MQQIEHDVWDGRIESRLNYIYLGLTVLAAIAALYVTVSVSTLVRPSVGRWTISLQKCAKLI